MSLKQQIDSIFDWNLRPNILSEVYLTTEQFNEVNEWLEGNRQAERNRIFDLIKNSFDWSNVWLELNDSQLIEFDPDIIVEHLKNRKEFN